MKQQLSIAAGLVVEQAGLGVLGNIAANQPELVVADLRLRLFDRDLAVANAFHLAAAKYDPAFELVQNLVLVRRPPIAANTAGILVGGLFRLVFGHDQRSSFP
jgi:hypothetical protein